MHFCRLCWQRIQSKHCWVCWVWPRLQSESLIYPQGGLRPVALANNWQPGKVAPCSIPVPSPPLLPELELFFLRNSATIHGSRKYTPTYLLWLTGRRTHSEQTPDTRRGYLRVKKGGRAEQTDRQKCSGTDDEERLWNKGNIRKSQRDVAAQWAGLMEEEIITKGNVASGVRRAAALFLEVCWGGGGSF